MKILKLSAVALAMACAAAPAAAAAPDTWDGTANYGVGAETVGPFNTYDFSSGGVLLIDQIANTTSANGYYQSFVSNHLLDSILVANPLLNSSYEVTVVADFTSQLVAATLNSQTFQVTGGSFSLWLDTTPDRNFATDSGFSNGVKIMQGSVISGGGSTFNFLNQQFGGGGLQLNILSYDTSVFNPNTIGGGESIFSLRLGAKVDQTFLNPITSVQGVQYLPLTGDLKYAADGNLILTPVPEPERYAMLLAGLGLLGAVALRRMRS